MEPVTQVIESVQNQLTEQASTYSIDDIALLLQHISNTLDTILAIIILYLVIKFLWTFIAKWLFGGV